MQLIRILLISAAILILLTGLSVFFGSPKQGKGNGARFLLATLGAAFWTVAITIFLKIPEGQPEFAKWVVVSIIAGVTLCDVGILAYLGWSQKGGKITTVLFAVAGAVIVGLLVRDPSLFYTHIDFSQEYTHLYLNRGWYYFTLIAYFFLISIAFSGFLQKRIKSTNNKNVKTGLQVFLVGLSIGGICSLVFNLILITSQPQLTWIGPMSISIAILAFYYSVVKFRVLSLSTSWMKVMSYVIFAASAVILYFLVFYAVFNALFKIPNPSAAILILNITMAVALLAAMPAISELVTFVRATIFMDHIELSYIMKKLENINKNSFDPKDIAKFLADSMHYSYVILELNDRLYASDTTRLSVTESEQLVRAKRPEGSIWIMPSDLPEELAQQREISRIAILTSKTGKEIGRVIFGKKITRMELSRKDLVKYEAVIGMLSAITEENFKLK